MPKASFLQLISYLKQFFSDESNREKIELFIDKAVNENPWFTDSLVRTAMNAIHKQFFSPLAWQDFFIRHPEKAKTNSTCPLFISFLNRCSNKVFISCSSSTTNIFAMVARISCTYKSWVCCESTTWNDNDTWAPTTKPSVSRFLRSMRALCSSAIFLTTAKPKPVPRLLVVT